MFGRRRKSHAEDLERELHSHLEAEAAEQQEHGYSAEEARYAARRALGNTTLVKEEVRAMWEWSALESLFQDVRYGSRILIRNLRVTLLAGAILGLAIGGSAAVFALIDAVFLRPLPGVNAPGQLVHFERVQPGLSATNFSYPDYLAYRETNSSFAGLAAHCAAPFAFSRATTERVIGDLVTGNYFSVLGVRPARGRLLMNDDERANAPPVAVLSYGFWSRAFALDPDIVGKSVTLNGHRFQVVGVADANFIGTEIGQPIAAWIPLSWHAWGLPGLSSGILENRAAGWIDVFGRLKAAVGLPRAQAEMTDISSRLGQEYSTTNAHRRVRLIRGVGIDPDDQGDLGVLLGLLFGAVAILLATACANIATLLLARSMARSREMALRLAIGGTRSRIVRQLVVEALLLSLAAGLSGIFLMPVAARLMAAFRTSPSALRGIDPAFDWRVAAFIVVVVAILGIVLGVAPALESCKTELAVSLKQASRTSSTRHARKQQLLVICQLSLSFLLLTGTGLMLKTMHALLTIDPGFHSQNVLLVSTYLGLDGYSESRGQQFYSSTLDRIQELPGVQSAAFARMAPPQELNSRVSVFYPGEAPPPDVERGREFELGLRVDLNAVTPHYFRTLEVPLLSGRDFDAHDNGNSRLVAVVSKALADRMWPGQYAIGKQIVWPSFEGPPRPPLTVIGIAGNTRERALGLDPPPTLYVPVAQSYAASMTLLIKTANDPALLKRQVQEQLAAIDKSVPLFHVESMQEHVAQSLWRQRTTLAMIGAFGAVSILIAAIGLYGVLSQWVFQRMREIGIRVAVGAHGLDVLRLVFGQAMGMAGAGVLTGVVVALGLTRLLSTLLFGISPLDPGVFAGAALSLIAMSVVACYVPAQRAMRVDPMVALRYE